MSVESEAAVLVLTMLPRQAVTHCTVRAAKARTDGREEDARYWTAVAVEVCDLGGLDPDAFQVLSNLQSRQ